MGRKSRAAEGGAGEGAAEEGGGFVLEGVAGRGAARAATLVRGEAGGVVQGGEAAREPERAEPGLVHPRGFLAGAEAEEDDGAEGDADPAVEGDGAGGGDHDNVVPGGRVVDRGPGVGDLREHGVGVEDVGLHREDDGHDDEGDGEEAQEARAREAGARGREDGGEVAPVFAQAVDREEGVVGGREAEEGGPDEDQDEGRPGVVHRGGAAGDGEEVVPRGLDDVVDYDDVAGWAEAQGAVEEVAAEALLAGAGDDGLAGIEGAGERSGDAED